MVGMGSATYMLLKTLIFIPKYPILDSTINFSLHNEHDLGECEKFDRQQQKVT